MRLALATALALCAQAAVACPTAEDMAGGVRVTFADGGYSDFRQEPGSVWVNVETPFEHGFIHKQYAKGFYLVSFQPDGIIDGGSYYAYEVPPEDLPDPAPGQGYRLSAEFFSVATGETRFRFITEAMSSFAIGDCVFAGFEGTEGTPSGLFGTRTRNATKFLYLSDLHIRLDLWAEEYGESRTMPEAISIVAID